MLRESDDTLNWLFGERIKAELHIAFQVLDELERLKPAELDGGRRVAQAFFEALRQDVVLASNVLSNRGADRIRNDLGELERHVIEAAGRSILSEFREARECLARAMSAATSIASKGGK